jgi:hypothetical protein
VLHKKTDQIKFQRSIAKKIACVGIFLLGINVVVPHAIFYIGRSAALFYKSIHPDRLDVLVKMSDSALLFPVIIGVFFVSLAGLHSRIAKEYLASLKVVGMENPTERDKLIADYNEQVLLSRLVTIGLGLSGLLIICLGLYFTWVKYSGYTP